MVAVNQKVCDLIIKRGKWKPVFCQLCVRVDKHSACPNWRAQMAVEDLAQQEKSEKFDERREVVAASQEAQE